MDKAPKSNDKCQLSFHPFWITSHYCKESNQNCKMCTEQQKKVIKILLAAGLKEN